ncbi:hypothetical protein JKG68_07700 [Microvirga aerilata]|uniref:Uncharacterized protein n=2 Tax=Microvirga aerilata TaxID=670292 RepID=A0A937CWL3_9HYPH|nr:hypothetical protein [Microvirga aerilata]MBL0403843.1 hypothetical protein [Microvirga aerilata]
MDAPVVFIGMEEGLGSDQHLEEDLIRRSGYKDIEELKGGNRKGQRTWRAMCDLMLRREGINDLNSDKRNDYQAKKLGRAHGDTLLTELLPYPHNKASDWLYTPYGRYPDRQQYLKAMLPTRKGMLQDLLLQTRREIVVCYGKEHWPHYRDLFAPETSPRYRELLRGIKWKDQKPFSVAQMNETRIVLAPHFSSRAFNTSEQLRGLSRAALCV